MAGKVDAPGMADQAFQDLHALARYEASYGDRQAVKLLQKTAKALYEYLEYEHSPEHESVFGNRMAQPSPPAKTGRAREADLTVLLEASYELADGRQVFYDDGPIGKGLLQDAMDLYAVLPEEYHTGSPNLENEQAQDIVGMLQSGAPLSEVLLGTLLGLLDKHRTKIDALRRSRDRQGQDFARVAADTPDQRILSTPPILNGAT